MFYLWEGSLRLKEREGRENAILKDEDDKESSLRLVYLTWLMVSSSLSSLSRLLLGIRDRLCLNSFLELNIPRCLRFYNLHRQK